MTIGYEIIIAIYGAVVSTAVAIFQYIQYREGHRFVHMTVSRSYGTDSELVKLKLSNRSRGGVELQEAFAYNLGLGGEVGFHELEGRSIQVFKDDGGHEFEADGSLRMPLRLGPGESICAFFSSEDAEKFKGMDLDDFPGAIRSNLFLFEVVHSRSDAPSKLYFEMERRYITSAFSNWIKLVPLHKRWKFRPIFSAQLKADE